MTENEVNIKVKHWLVAQGFHYKGILNVGKGQVPAPDENRQVLIDHQGVKDNPIDLIWVEAKGSGCGMSTLLQGFIRTVYAIWNGGGNGFLAIPNEEFLIMKKQAEFLERVSQSVNGKGQMGVLNVETNEIVQF